MEKNIVKTVKSGEVTLVFHDDFCRDQTSEEVRSTLDRIAEIALPGWKPPYLHKGNSA